MIQICDLQFDYGKNGFALEVDELMIGAGERITWIGRSGTGKTTLLHLVAGIIRPKAGDITCCGTSITELVDSACRDFRIRNIGLVFQDFALLEYLTVLDNILLPYRINQSLLLDKSAETRATELAIAVGLASMLQRTPAHLSQGERQRVAVCRALITEPKVVLADEPTANLDNENATHVLNILDQYALEHGATLIVVSHDQIVLNRCKRVIDISSFCSNPSTNDVGENLVAE